jgi:hypothetical protein
VQAGTAEARRCGRCGNEVACVLPAVEAEAASAPRPARTVRVPLVVRLYGVVLALAAGLGALLWLYQFRDARPGPLWCGVAVLLACTLMGTQLYQGKRWAVWPILIVAVLGALWSVLAVVVAATLQGSLSKVDRITFVVPPLVVVACLPGLFAVFRHWKHLDSSGLSLPLPPLAALRALRGADQSASGQVGWQELCALGARLYGVLLILLGAAAIVPEITAFLRRDGLLVGAAVACAWALHVVVLWTQVRLDAEAKSAGRRKPPVPTVVRVFSVVLLLAFAAAMTAWLRQMEYPDGRLLNGVKLCFGAGNVLLWNALRRGRAWAVDLLRGLTVGVAVGVLFAVLIPLSAGQSPPESVVMPGILLLMVYLPPLISALRHRAAFVSPIRPEGIPARADLDDGARYKLCALISEHGVALCDDPARCKAMLEQACPQAPREVSVLLQALAAQVPRNLLAYPDGLPWGVISDALAAGLPGKGQLAGEARWAVESWALALDKVTGGQLEEWQEQHGAGAAPGLSAAPHTPLFRSLSVVVGIAGLVFVALSLPLLKGARESVRTYDARRGGWGREKVLRDERSLLGLCRVRPPHWPYTLIGSLAILIGILLYLYPWAWVRAVLDGVKQDGPGGAGGE